MSHEPYRFIINLDGIFHFQVVEVQVIEVDSLFSAIHETKARNFANLFDHDASILA